ncbi:MAG: hypothetical protein ACI9FJ_002815 [Alteromonadaceae bacterium]
MQTAQQHQSFAGHRVGSKLKPQLKEAVAKEATKETIDAKDINLIVG